MGGDLLFLLVALGLVLLNGFFVAAEFAIVKVRATRIRELAEQGSWRAVVAKGVIEHLDAYLSATQLGITIASIGLGWVGEPAVAHLLRPVLHLMGVMSERAVHGVALAVAFALISFVHIVLGELAPKSLAIRLPEATSLWVAGPLRLFYYVMYPAIVALNKTANGVLWLAGIKPASENGEEALSEEELRMVVASSHAQGVLNATERTLLENVFDFSERQVGQIMMPRLDMTCLYTDKSLAENLAIVQDQLHTRYPLATTDKDHILGMVHVKDLLRIVGQGRTDVPIESIKRSILFVPETATIDRLLKSFQQQRHHMAIVVDEYGGIAGLVTLEDVLEELVGPIRDEFDVEEAQREAQASHSLVEGSVPLDEALAPLGLEPPEDARVNTVGGYILQRLGRVPRVGEGVTVGPWRAEVAAMENLRITQVRFRRLPTPAGEKKE